MRGGIAEGVAEEEEGCGAALVVVAFDEVDADTEAPLEAGFCDPLELFSRTHNARASSRVQFFSFLSSMTSFREGARFIKRKGN